MNVTDINLNEFIKESSRFLAQKKGQKVLDRLDQMMASYINHMDEAKLIIELSELHDFIEKEFEL